MFALPLVFAGCEKETDFPSSNGLFSVSEDGHQVRFALGNLEYDGSYHFAAHQYDYGGYFGMETCGDPTITATDSSDYTLFDDWGSHIGNGWRTLTHDEWAYVIWERAGASNKRGAATVCGVHGMVLLPDEWHGGTFHAGFNYENNDTVGWNRNVYDASSWSSMEAAGAVFLPAAGYGMEVGGAGSHGCYWSFPPNYGHDEDYIYFKKSRVDFYAGGFLYDGMSVRLVQDY